MATGGVRVPKISLTVPDISLTAPSYLQPDERTTEQPNTAGLDPNIAGKGRQQAFVSLLLKVGLYFLFLLNFDFERCLYFLLEGNFLAEELSNVSMAKEINWSGDQPDIQGSIPLVRTSR